MPDFLHVGCGPLDRTSTTPGFNRPDWREVRLDIDPSARPDVVASMTDMSAVAAGSMDGLYSSHNLEHLYAFEAPLALAEFVRVLKPDGFAVVTCPDIQAVAAAVAQGRLLEPLYRSPAGEVSALDVLYGMRSALAQGNLYMAHRCAFTGPVLAGLLREAGFGGVLIRRRPWAYDLWAVATRQPVGDGARLRSLAAEHLPAGQARVAPGA